MTENSDNHINPNPPPVRPPPLVRVKNWYRALPDKKRHLEFITAFLTIPVLLTVLLSNISNLQNQKNSAKPAPTPVSSAPNIIIMPASTTPSSSPSATPAPTPSAQCTKAIGPISIAYPEEGNTVTGDPVCLDIVRSGTDYCSVVWSYRINGGAWSDNTDKSICMYSLPAGTKKLDLRVKSIVSSDEQILTRTFTVAGTPSPTSTPVSTQSGMLGN